MMGSIPVLQRYADLPGHSIRRSRFALGGALDCARILDRSLAVPCWLVPAAPTILVCPTTTFQTKAFEFTWGAA